MKKPDQEGATLVETTVAVALLSSMALSVMAARGFMDRQALRAQDRAFAAGKAAQMFGELGSLAGRSGVQALDSYDNGNQFSPVLTTDKTLAGPGAVAAPPDPAARALKGRIP